MSLGIKQWITQLCNLAPAELDTATRDVPTTVRSAIDLIVEYGHETWTYEYNARMRVSYGAREFTPQTAHCLTQLGITSDDDLIKFSIADLMLVHGIGPARIIEINIYLATKGLVLRGSPPRDPEG